MKRILLLIIGIILFLPVFAEESGGVYYIAGKVYLNKQIVKNSVVIIDVWDKKTEVIVDENGAYEFKMEWYKTCPSGLSKTEYNRENNEINPKWIPITLNKIEIKVKNLWEKYAKHFNTWEEYTSRKSEITYYIDLKFSD